MSNHENGQTGEIIEQVLKDNNIDSSGQDGEDRKNVRVEVAGEISE